MVLRQRILTLNFFSYIRQKIGSMESIYIAILKFEEFLGDAETRCFRGAIVDLVGKGNMAFHNHLSNDRLSYSYPLVQYKRIDGKMAIVGIGTMADCIMQLAGQFPRTLKIGKKDIAFHVQSCKIEKYQPIMEVNPKLYSIKDYIALTDENLKKYNSMLALTDKLSFLEDILTGNILSFLKGIGYHAEDRIFCAITTFSEPHIKYYKGVHFNVFNLSFVSNIELPSGISLGKSGSVGFGVLKKEMLPGKFDNFESKN